MAKLSRPCTQWLQVGVVALGVGAAAAAGQGLATASPDQGGVTSTSDSVGGAGNTTAADVPSSKEDQSAAAADPAPTTAAPSSSQESTTTSLGDGPTSTLSAQQNSSKGDEAGDGSEVEPEPAQPVASAVVDADPPTVEPATVEPDAVTADSASAAGDHHDVADTAPALAKTATAEKLAAAVKTPADGDGQASSGVAEQETGAVDNAKATAPTAQAASSAVTPFPTAPLDLPPNPIRTLVAAVLGLFGFNPEATAPSTNPLNPFLELAWGFYRRIETTIAETAYAFLGIKLITTTVPTSDTGIDLLGNTRDLNVVWVDGQGFVGYQLTDTTRDIAIYQTGWYTTIDGLLYPANPPGDNVVKGPTEWDPSAVSAYANMAAVYDFYENTLDRTSFDDNGATVRITVVSNALDNAYWYRTYHQFVFGHDFEAALDVVGHEYTHAVIDAIVASQNGGLILDGTGESKALGEAYADIMGSLIEGKSGADEWLLGEDYGCSAPSASTGCAIRNLADPSAFGDPENYSSYNANADEHFNSTIFSFAAFKMMTDPKTTGVSRDTWAAVYYHSLYGLPASASFAEARAAVLASAASLGFTANQLQAVGAAFDAVGITPAATATSPAVDLSSLLRL